MRRFFVLFTVLFLFQSQAMSAKLYNEHWYQNQWCTRWGGRQEVKLEDFTRIDCVTKNYVVEFDFGRKWAECLGQSLHYSAMTGKKGACILILEKPSDYKYFERLRLLGKKHGIQVWYMKSPLYTTKGKLILGF